MLACTYIYNVRLDLDPPARVERKGGMKLWSMICLMIWWNECRGDIYLGVVGPVRTGKSTFIRKFMELFVLPKIDDPLELERIRDELPQGSMGKLL